MHAITFTPSVSTTCQRLAHAGRFLAVAAVITTTSLAAHATGITYTFTGLASGTFTPTGGVGTTFTNQAYSTTIVTDTTNISTTRFGAGIPATASLVPGSVSISGVGSGSFTQPLYVFNNQGTQVVGFGNLASNDLINVKNLSAGLNTYGLVTTYGPVVGTPPNFVSQFQNISTSFGTLSLSSLNNATFNAVLAVPEPQTWALMAAGFFLVAAKAGRAAKARRV